MVVASAGTLLEGAEGSQVVQRGKEDERQLSGQFCFFRDECQNVLPTSISPEEQEVTAQ